MRITTENAPTVDKELEAGLADVRLRRRLPWAILAGGPPAVAALGWLVAALTGIDFADACELLVSPWLLMLVVAMSRAREAPCPRCRRPFAVRDDFSDPWARRCLHCGLVVRPTRARGEAAGPPARP